VVLVNFVSSFTCEDDLWRDCQRRVERGACQGIGDEDPQLSARTMLAVCRKSCRDLFLNKTQLPEIILKYGGLEDHVIDPFGFKYPLCAENGGFTASGRVDVLFQQALMKDQAEWVPKFTQVGFEKMKIPAELYRMLLEDYERVKPGMVEEFCVQAVINCQEIRDMGEESTVRTRRRTFMMELSVKVLEALNDGLHPLAEAWADIKLQHTATYGIRRYTNGSWLASHLDRFSTHVISAILNIGQAVDEDWPLYILDNSGTPHSVLLQPGDMLWYESARAVHGRPQHFKGEYFDNLFIHYSPTGAWYNEQYQIGRQPRETPYTVEEIRRAQGVKE